MDLAGLQRAAAEKVKETFSSSDFIGSLPAVLFPAVKKVLIFPYARTNAQLLSEAVKQMCKRTTG